MSDPLRYVLLFRPKKEAMFFMPVLSTLLSDRWAAVIFCAYNNIVLIHTKHRLCKYIWQ